MNPISIFACEAQPIMLDGLVRIISEAGDLRLAGSAPDLGAALSDIVACRPDVLIVGLPAATRSVQPFLAKLRDAQVRSGVILWANSVSDVDSFRALQLGARGVISRLRSGEFMLECIRAVANGEIWLEDPPEDTRKHSAPNGAHRLTPREKQIAELVCRGLRNKEIAEEMSITPGTVKVHLMHIFEKTGYRDRFQLALHGKRLLNQAPPEDEDCEPLLSAAGG